MSIALIALIVSVSLVIVLIPTQVWKLAMWALLLYVSGWIAYLSLLALLSQSG